MHKLFLIACNHALQRDCFWDISTNSIPKGQGWWLWQGLSSANSLQLLFEPWLAAIGGFNRPSWKCNCALSLCISPNVVGISLKLGWSKIHFFSSSQSHSSYLHAKLKFTWPMLSIVKNICVALYWMRKFSKRKLKDPCLWTVAPLIVSDERSGKSNLSHAVVNPRPCVRIIMKLVFPSKFPIIRGTSSVCVKLYINIIFWKTDSQENRLVGCKSLKYSN